MIPYALNNEVRKTTTVFLVLISICVTVIIENIFMKYFNNLNFQSDVDL